MNGAGEADADDEPEEAGEEAELDGEDGTDEGTSAGDGGEVVSEEDGGVGGVVVLSIILEDSGGGAAVIETGHMIREEEAIETIGYDEGSQCATDEGQCMHESRVRFDRNIRGDLRRT